MLKPQKVGMVPDRDPDHHTLVGPQADHIAHAAALAVEIGRQKKISGKTRVRKTGDGWRGSEIESNQQTLVLRFAQEQEEISNSRRSCARSPREPFRASIELFARSWHRSSPVFLVFETLSNRGRLRGPVPQRQERRVGS
jgi:hypothetical protein